MRLSVTACWASICCTYKKATPRLAGNSAKNRFTAAGPPVEAASSQSSLAGALCCRLISLRSRCRRMPMRRNQAVCPSEPTANSLLSLRIIGIRLWANRVSRCCPSWLSSATSTSQASSSAWASSGASVLPSNTTLNPTLWPACATSCAKAFCLVVLSTSNPKRSMAALPYLVRMCSNSWMLLSSRSS